MTIRECIKQKLPFVIYDDGYYPINGGSVVACYSEPLKSYFRIDLGGGLDSEVEDYALPEDIYDTIYNTQEEVTQVTKECTCISLLSGHIPECPYLEGK